MQAVRNSTAVGASPRMVPVVVLKSHSDWLSAALHQISPLLPYSDLNPHASIGPLSWESSRALC
jgi:hypothetical protein